MPTLNTLFGDVLLLEERLKPLVRASVLAALRSGDLLGATQDILVEIIRGLEAGLRPQYSVVEGKALRFASSVAGGPVTFTEDAGVTEGLALFRSLALQTAQTFTIELNSLVDRMLRAGVQPEAIRVALVAGLRDEALSRPVVSLLAGLAQAAASGVQQTANSAMISAMAATDGLPNEDDEEWVWVTVEDNRVCTDCQPRHNQIKSLTEWRALGLPKAGSTVCGDRCRCMIMPAEFADEELDLNAPIKLDRKRVLEIGARAAQLAAKGEA